MPAGVLFIASRKIHSLSCKTYAHQSHCVKYSCDSNASHALISNGACVFAWLSSSINCKNYAPRSRVTEKFHSRKRQEKSSQIRPSFSAYVWTDRDALISWQNHFVSSCWSARFSIMRNWNICSPGFSCGTLNSKLFIILSRVERPLSKPTIQSSSQSGQGN